MSNKAKVGDIIQYRFRTGGGFVSYDTRFVEMIDAAGYWVQGGYCVAQKDVLTAIPMHAEEQKSEVRNQRSHLLASDAAGSCAASFGEDAGQRSSSERRSLTSPQAVSGKR